MVFDNVIITYQDIKDGKLSVRDDYGIAGYEYERRREAFLACPNETPPSFPYLYLSLADGIVVGRTFCFNTIIKAGEEQLLTSTGSALLVHEDYRKYALAIDLMMFNKSELQLTAGVSQIALPLYDKLKYFVFKFPKLRLIKDYKTFLLNRGLPNCFSIFASSLLRLFSISKSIRRKKHEKKLNSIYRIIKVNKIPEWVDEVVINDGHKYSEIHNHNWFQWNLDYNFKSDPKNIQSFYVVYKGNEICAFFMTKERLMPTTSSTDLIVGSVVEWGIKTSKSITEAEINILSLGTFSDRCSYIELASDSKETVDKMLNMGFKRLSEDANVLFRDRTKDKRFKDAKDPSLWRLRLGYADTIMSY